MALTLRTLVNMNKALIGVISMTSALVYCILLPASIELPYTSARALPADMPYVYESRFPLGELGVLDASYGVAEPQLISGTDYIENGLLKIISNNQYQVGFGMEWKTPYEKGVWEPWLPLFWKYHVDVTFIKEGEIPTLVVENWIAWETGKSITAMVWYQNGSLAYSYGAFPGDHSYGVLLDRFDLPSEFNVTVDADYRAKSMVIDWSGHKHTVPLQIERIGTIPKPFTSFLITLTEPGIIYVRNLKVVLANS